MPQSLPELVPNDPNHGSHDLRQQTIENRRVVIGGGDVCDRLLNCTFIGCEIRIECSGRQTSVALGGNTFKNSVIRPSRIQKVTNLQTHFYSCEFRGAYEIEFHGDVANCQFSAAKLNHALFFKPVELATESLPAWPHVYVSNLDQFEEDFMATVPKMSLLWMMARKHPQSIVFNIEKAITSPQDTWKSLKQKSYAYSIERDA